MLKRKRVLLVEHQRLFREGLRLVLGDRFEVVGEAETARRCNELVRTQRPDLIVLPSQLPDADCENLIKQLSEQNIKTVVLSAITTEDVVLCLIRAGARAFVSKTQDSACIRNALEVVSDGGVFLCPVAAQILVQHVMRQGRGMLSDRERQVLRMIVNDNDNKSIAFQLSLGVTTVKSYRRTLMSKLGVRSVAGLIRKAAEAKLVEPAVEL